MDWSIAEGVTYLNHGSFGPTLRKVQEVREHWLREHASNPMDFFVRRLEPLLRDAESQLARFVKCPADNLVFMSNATAGMNVVAENVELAAGDEVLLTDHEYGAVVRIWGRACQKVGAKTVIARLPVPLESTADIVEAIFSRVNEHTRLIVVSHVTSPTAVILPVKEICERARKQGVLVCVDGPHALAMTDLHLDQIPCDFYTASCHKWLSAPYGSGFLYVRSRHKQGLRPNVVSWGRSLQGNRPSWKDEFHWPGTFDPTACLCVPTAISCLKDYGEDVFRAETHALAAEARRQLLQIDGASALTPDSPDWYGSMVTIRLPASANRQQGDVNQPHPLQQWLWEEERIEIPVVRWHDEVHIRVSCHLYNSCEQIGRLCSAVKEWLECGSSWSNG